MEACKESGAFWPRPQIASFVLLLSGLARLLRLPPSRHFNPAEGGGPQDPSPVLYGDLASQTTQLLPAQTLRGHSVSGFVSKPQYNQIALASIFFKLLNDAIKQFFCCFKQVFSLDSISTGFF